MQIKKYTQKTHKKTFLIIHIKKHSQKYTHKKLTKQKQTIKNIFKITHKQK